MIRLYLQLQIDAVDAKIRETEESGEPSAPTSAEREGSFAVGFRLQHVPRGGTLRGVVHRGDCPDGAGDWLTPREVEIAFRMPDVTPCPRCHASLNDS